MSEMGKLLMLAGLVLLACGAAIAVAGKISWLGKLPGDIFVRRGNFTFYFPLATCVLVSLIISFIFWLIRK